MSMNNEVQTIEGKDLDDCKEKLYELYGKSYNIQDVKTVLKHPGFLGIGQKNVVKVWYNVKNTKLEAEGSAGRPKANFAIPDALFSLRYGNMNDDFQKNKNEILKQATGMGDASVTNFLQMTQMQKDITEKFSALGEKMDLLVEKTNSDSAHPSIAKIEEMLEENDFSAVLTKEIKARLLEELTIGELDDFDEVQKTVVDWIGNRIKIAAPKAHKKPRVIIIVGPTGVGKTTTIAKIAALSWQEATDKKIPRPRIHMLTIDNMRVGAKEQLQKYADIFQSPLDSAETPEEVKRIYEKVKDDIDMLLIDTSGFSPNDSENIGKMRKVLNVNEMDADVFLAFDATKTASSIKSVMQNFEPFGYENVIVTKCDEAERFGGVLSAVIEKGKAISFIADGQKAHKNLSRATKQYFLKRLYNFKIDPEHLDDLFPEEK